MTQLNLLDGMEPRISVVDRNVEPADRPRLMSQSDQVLAQLRRGPQTNMQLKKISHRFGGRLGDLRKAGYLIDTEKRKGGVFGYTLREAGNG